MKNAIDNVLRDEQAGFRKERSSADQIATVRIIVEQSIEWQSPLYKCFIDFEKVFESVDRESSWKILLYYGVLQSLSTLSKKFMKGSHSESFMLENSLKGLRSLLE